LAACCPCAVEANLLAAGLRQNEGMADVDDGPA
jgi:hypothetical protein